MKRIDADEHVNNRFSDGNPQAGQGATVVSASWLNGVQEEIANVIELSGGALDEGLDTQLYNAIVATVAGAIGTGGASVPTTRQVGTSGLATGGGNLAADRTIAVAKASAADVLTGTADDRAITPLALKTALASTLGANGYYILPGGLILQWGIVRGFYVEGVVSVTLPIAFPTAFAVVNVTAVNQSGSNDRDVWSQNVSRTLSSFSVYQQYDGSGSNVSDGFDFFALGY